MLVLVLSAGLAAGISELTSGSGAQPTTADPASAPEIGAVPAREASLFAILRTPRTASDAFAPVRARGTAPLGANPALARSVHEPRGGLSSGLVSVVPANGAVCLRVPSGHDVAQWWCQRTAAAARGQLLMAVRPPGRLRASDQLIIGLVPDRVRSVLISAAGGVRRAVAVRHNIYDTQIYAPTSVLIDLPGRSTVRYRAP
jgi:hypothetical protein